MSSYDFLAGCYDELTTDVGYPAWADYLEAHFRRKGLPGRTVLDLACGTGSLTWELAARGYEMIGVDRSPEMLAEAAAKGREDVETPPIFLCQSMDRLDLYGTMCLLSGQRQLCHRPQAAEESLCPGLAVSHARRAVPVRHQYAVQAAWAGRAGLFGRDGGHLLRLAGGV
mgnify:CR=1 FL=1